MYENLSISGKIRYRLSRVLWPEAEPLPWAYESDGFATLHSAGFRDEPKFVEAYARAKATGAWHGADIEWRAYTVCWAAMKARGLDGDFVECGVDRGGFSIAAMHYIDFASLSDRKFYLVDTYEGIPPDTLEGDRQREVLASRYERTYDAVVRTFAPFPNAVVVQGRVPEILPTIPAGKISYLCIDLNTAGPSVAAADFFWDRLVPGAPVVLDDYGQTFFTDMKSALDDFARRRGVQVLPLPTGQGLLFKP
jgi:O-methyltransferase